LISIPGSFYQADKLYVIKKTIQPDDDLISIQARV